jgi:hypothetical protein
MRDMIAMLDGYSVEKFNTSPSEGGNYSGGAAWAPGFPTMPTGSGGLAADLAQRGYSVEYNTSPSAGGNYSGGGAWAPGFPTMPTGSGGLAEYAVSPSGGDNYTGGATWAPGFPLSPSSQGLASAHPAVQSIARLISVCRAVLARYASVCAAGGESLLRADQEARRYGDWISSGGYGDPRLAARAGLLVLRAYAKHLGRASASCSGTVLGATPALRAMAREALKLAAKARA